MNPKAKQLLLLSSALLFSCSSAPSSSEGTSSETSSSQGVSSTEEPSIPSSSSSSASSKEYDAIIDTTVYGNTALPDYGKVAYSYEGKDIYVDEKAGTVSGTKGGTETVLTAKGDSFEKKILVKVANRDYVSKHASAEEKEEWFKPVTIDPITPASSGVNVEIRLDDFDSALLQNPQFVYKKTSGGDYSYAKSTSIGKGLFSLSLSTFEDGDYLAHIATWEDVSPWTEHDLYAEDGKDFAFTVSGGAKLSFSGKLGEAGALEVSPVESEFANGIDISSSKMLIDAGQRYYDEEGTEKSLFRILSEHNVNWVRLRLWNDPYNHNFTKSGSFVPYGGGICDFDTVLWEARQAKYFGLKVLLDFHYSDFWSDPSNQVIPKAWAGIKTSADMAKAISDYTSETLVALDEGGAKPDMVAIGNEVTSGILLHMPGQDKGEYTGGNPGYITGKYNASSDIAGKMGTPNFKAYVKAGVDAVKAYDPSIQTMVHVAKGLTAIDTIKGYYNQLDGVDYDVIGLSAYSYYQYSNNSILKSAIDTLASAFPSKKVAIAETAYGFTYEADKNASNIFQSSGTAKPVSGYPCSVQGQASIIADATRTLASNPNGMGCFYWEGAWTPVAFCGWADKASLASWANQGFFSYNGKALGSLGLYQQLWK